MKTEIFTSRNRERYLVKKAISQVPQNAIGSLFNFFNNKCAYCETNKAVCLDHVTPIKYKNDNSPQNLLPVCTTCNSSKNAKHFLQTIEWYHNKFNKPMSDKIKTILFYVKEWDDVINLPYILEDNSNYLKMLEEFKHV